MHIAEHAQALPAVQVFRNLVSVLRLIGKSKAPPSSAGLSLLVAATPSDTQSSLGTGSGYARRELGYAWDCLQKEAQALLSELLQQGDSQGLREFQTGQPSFGFCSCLTYSSQLLAIQQCVREMRLANQKQRGFDAASKGFRSCIPMSSDSVSNSGIVQL